MAVAQLQLQLQLQFARVLTRKFNREHYIYNVEDRLWICYYVKPESGCV